MTIAKEEIDAAVRRLSKLSIQQSRMNNLAKSKGSP